MALPLPPGLTPPESAFLAEMELVTVIPRQRLESFTLLSGPTPPLRPPHRASLPLWLALLLTRQRRADIVPPPWLSKDALQAILDREVGTEDAFTSAPAMPAASFSASTGERVQRTPPFVPTSTVGGGQIEGVGEGEEEALPYHYLALSTLLLTHCAQSIPEAEAVRRLLRDISEVRGAKMRRVVQRVDGGAGIRMSGVGAMEVSEGRAFLGMVVDGLRKVGASKEERVREEADRGAVESDGDEDML